MLMYFGKCQLLSLLKDWLSLVEVCILDTSLCNVKQRELFLNHLSSGAVIFHGSENEFLTESYLSWIHFRNIYIDKLIVNKLLSQCKFSLFVHVFENMKALSFPRCDSIQCFEDLLVGCCNLTDITLTNSRFVNDFSVFWFVTYCRSLLKCDFTGLTQITDNAVGALSIVFTQLTSVNLSACILLTDTSIIELTTNCIDLTSLSLNECKITEATLKNISKHNKSLTFLGLQDISEDNTVPSAVIENLIKSCSKLRTFRLTHYVTNAVLECIATHLPYITDLNISYSDEVTDVGIISLCNGCKQIQKFGMSSLYSTTIKSVVAICATQSQLTTIVCSRGPVEYDRQLMSILSMKFVDLSDVVFNCAGPRSFAGKTREATNEGLFAALKQVDMTKDCDDANLFDMVLSQFSSSLLHVTLPVYCEDITLEVLFAQCPNLTFVDLYWLYSTLTDATLRTIGANCHYLREFRMKYSELCSDVGLCDVIRNNHELTSLQCTHCVWLTDVTLKTLGQSCPLLKSLDISYSKVTNKEVEYLSEKCCKLTELDITACAELTDVETLVAIVEKNCKFMGKCECGPSNIYSEAPTSVEKAMAYQRIMSSHNVGIE